MKNEKRKIIMNIIEKSNDLNDDQKQKLRQNLIIELNKYSIELNKTDVVPYSEDETTKAIKMFFISKKIQGCSDNTIHYYKTVLKNFFNSQRYDIKSITTDDIRYYLAIRSMNDKISKVSQDNELRILKSFFKWCYGEGYIEKIPTLNIPAIKKEKVIKKPFTETELELLKQSAGNKRDIAIIDTLYSTGMRVSELISVDKTDLDNNEIIIMGKGGKERRVFLNERSVLSINQYLKERTDNNNALFVTLKKPNKRLEKGSVERIIKNIGEKAGIKNCHPHRFRRTMATNALNRGMPIDQVSQMLGHSNIETTTIYARSEMENVKASHRKYVI